MKHSSAHKALPLIAALAMCSSCTCGGGGGLFGDPILLGDNAEDGGGPVVLDENNAIVSNNPMGRTSGTPGSQGGTPMSTQDPRCASQVTCATGSPCTLEFRVDVDSSTQKPLGALTLEAPGFAQAPEARITVRFRGSTSEPRELRRVDLDDERVELDMASGPLEIGIQLSAKDPAPSIADMDMYLLTEEIDPSSDLSITLPDISSLVRVGGELLGPDGEPLGAILTAPQRVEFRSITTPWRHIGRLMDGVYTVQLPEGTYDAWTCVTDTCAVAATEEVVVTGSDTVDLDSGYESAELISELGSWSDGGTISSIRLTRPSDPASRTSLSLGLPLEATTPLMLPAGDFDVVASLVLDDERPYITDFSPIPARVERRAIGGTRIVLDDRSATLTLTTRDPMRGGTSHMEIVPGDNLSSVVSDAFAVDVTLSSRGDIAFTRQGYEGGWLYASPPTRVTQGFVTLGAYEEFAAIFTSSPLADINQTQVPIREPITELGPGVDVTSSLDVDPVRVDVELGQDALFAFQRRQETATSVGPYAVLRFEDVSDVHRRGRITLGQFGERELMDPKRTLSIAPGDYRVWLESHVSIRPSALTTLDHVEQALLHEVWRAEEGATLRVEPELLDLEASVDASLPRQIWMTSSRYFGGSVNNFVGSDRFPRRPFPPGVYEFRSVRQTGETRWGITDERVQVRDDEGEWSECVVLVAADE